MSGLEMKFLLGLASLVLTKVEDKPQPPDRNSNCCHYEAREIVMDEVRLDGVSEEREMT